MSSNTNGDSFLTAMLSEFELCLNQRNGSLHLKDPNKENGNPGSLLTSIVLQAAGNLNGGESLSVLQKAEFRQWIEYLCIYGHLLQNSTSSHQVLKELNNVLGVKSFLTSNSYPTVIDAVFYGLLHKVMDPNKENGNPGSLLTSIVLQAAGNLNGGESLSVLQKAEFRQWIEYLCIYGHLLQNSTSSHQVLKELNNVLGVKSFLTSNSYPTVIDAVFYGLLHKVMSTITYQEKEQYVNLSRWFNTVQHDSLVRRSRSVVTFSKNALYT